MHLNHLTRWNGFFSLRIVISVAIIQTPCYYCRSLLWQLNLYSLARTQKTWEVWTLFHYMSLAEHQGFPGAVSAQAAGCTKAPGPFCRGFKVISISYYIYVYHSISLSDSIYICIYLYLICISISRSFSKLSFGFSIINIVYDFTKALF